MKRIVIFASALALCFSLQVQGMQSKDFSKGGMKGKMLYRKAPEKIAQFVYEIQGESISQPRWLMSKWHNLKARMLNLGAQELQNVAAQLKNPEEKAAYMQAARNVKRAAASIRNLPIPKQRVVKSLENLPEWMKLRAKKKLLMAKQLRIVSHQLGYPILRKKAYHIERWAKALLRELNQSSVRMQESMDRDQEALDVEEVPE